MGVVADGFGMEGSPALGKRLSDATMIGRQHAAIQQTSISLPATVSILAAAFLILAWPWLSGAVTIPWDAKSQFFPQVQFLARSIARGDWPWWTPNVFAGWPQICDPQSLMFSPLHLVLAALNPAVGSRAFDAVSFAYLFLGALGIVLFFRERGWHPGGALVAALAFAFGGSANARIQHTGEIISLAYLPLALWLMARALDRSSWRAGVAAGLVIALLAIGRDQVAMLSLYVLAGFICAYWIAGAPIIARMRASAAPLAAAALTAIPIAAIPVVATALLALRSNRPEIGYASAAAGSLHPVHLLQFVFADLFGAMDPTIDYWAPQSLIWDAAWGSPGLYLSQNMGLLYAGALTFAVVWSFGLIRGLAWESEIRFFAIATACMLLYALGGYTPFFRWVYEVAPGVVMFRRPADATFVLVALFAMLAGFLVHCWLSDAVPAPSRWQRAAEIASAIAFPAAALALAHAVVGIRPALVPVLTALIFTAGAILVLAAVRPLSVRWPLVGVALLAAFMVVDLAWNNAPNESTALPPGRYDALLQNTSNDTVALLRQRLAQTAAPDRRDRVELIGIGYQWPNLSLAQDFDHVFGHNPIRLRLFNEATHAGDTVALPEQRMFSPLYPSYRSAFANLLGVRFIATGVPVEQIDLSLKPGDLNFVARTSNAYVYENPRALPRAMLMRDWRLADIDDLLNAGWPDVDPAQTVLLQRAPQGMPAADRSSEVIGTARLVSYANTQVTVAVDIPAARILLFTDVWHPWWRADIDGQETQILRGDVIFRAVVVPPGRHQLRFTFHPIAGALAELLDKLARSDVK
jgi:hypothetical protein